jgi:ribose transport system substrate-binding protein
MKILTRRVSALVAVAALGLTTAGCGSSKSSSSASSASTSAPASTSSGSAAGGGGGSGAKTVGIVDFSADSLAAHAAYQSTVDAMKALGWKVLTGEAGGSPDAANTAMQQFASEHVDAIIPVVFPSSALSAGMAAAKAAKIPVFSLAGGLSPGVVGNLDATVPQASTELTLKAVAAATGKVKVLDMTYSPGTPCLVRSAYLKAQLAKDPNVQLTQKEVAVPGSLQSGDSVASAFLTTNPPSATQLIIYTCIADAAVGAVEAAQSANRTKNVQIYTSDSSPTVFQAVKKGTMDGMLWQDMPNAGTQFVGMLKEYFSTGKLANPDIPLHTESLTTSLAQTFLQSHPHDPTIT